MVSRNEKSLYSVQTQSNQSAQRRLIYGSVTTIRYDMMAIMAKCVFKCFASLARLTTSKQKLTRNKTKTERNEQKKSKSQSPRSQSEFVLSVICIIIRIIFSFLFLLLSVLATVCLFSVLLANERAYYVDTAYNTGWNHYRRTRFTAPSHSAIDSIHGAFLSFQHKRRPFATLLIFIAYYCVPWKM